MKDTYRMKPTPQKLTLTPKGFAAFSSMRPTPPPVEKPHETRSDETPAPKDER